MEELDRVFDRVMVRVGGGVRENVVGVLVRSSVWEKVSVGKVKDLDMVPEQADVTLTVVSVPPFSISPEKARITSLYSMQNALNFDMKKVILEFASKVVFLVNGIRELYDFSAKKSGEFGTD